MEIKHFVQKKKKNKISFAICCPCWFKFKNSDRFSFNTQGITILHGIFDVSSIVGWTISPSLSEPSSNLMETHKILNFIRSTTHLSILILLNNN